MSARLIDAHCHLADDRLFSRLDEILAAAHAHGIETFIQGGIHPVDWDRQLELQSRYPGKIHCCFGLHPWFVAGRMGVGGLELREQVRKGLELLPSRLSQAVGIGEMGIDLGPKTDPLTLEFQKEVFSEQLKIAQKLGKPLVLHIVRAHSEAIRILSEYGPYPQGGILHAFSGSYEISQEYARLGLTLSIGGTVARTGHETFKRALKKIPLDQIVLESDSPDQIPDPFQGLEPGLNDPRSLWTIAQAVIDLRGESGLQPADLLTSSRDRLVRIFNLPISSTEA